jgi:hypothetical protein
MELVIDEPIAGHFYWLVLAREVFGQPRGVVDHSHGPYPTHQQATDAGVAAMLRHSEPVDHALPPSSLPAKARLDTGPVGLR